MDHSATTPVDDRVAAAMVLTLTRTFGNASSVHSQGQQARAEVDRARREVAAFIGSQQNEIVFVSGGTEANNLAIRGLCQGYSGQGRHIVTSAIEHPSVRGVCDSLEKQGWSITRLPVYDNGLVKIEDVRSAIADGTVLVSIMFANNEIGVLQPIREIGKLSVIKAGGTKPEVLHQADFGVRILATPALVGERIYLRTATDLWAFGVIAGG